MISSHAEFAERMRSDLARWRTELAAVGLAPEFESIREQLRQFIDEGERLLRPISPPRVSAKTQLDFTNSGPQ